ncbi:HEAT repeat domain-containing protein [Tundrisphaera lichenicola]|uniref:HEAT repeat domain-containing protein n=1 Tax=Tundrisphaera lichenicola TaxID=2029860 RepID=UPI003EC01120
MISIVAIVAMTGCTGFQSFKFRGTTASSFLRTIEESRDPNERFIAYDSLSSPRCFDDENQKARASQILVEKLRSGKEPHATRAVICRTLGQLRRPEAREAILGLVEDEDNLVRAEACRALGLVGRTEDATVLARVMTVDVAAECRVAAIESLGELKAKDRRINEFLVNGMEHEEPAIRVASMNALKSITGRDLGVDAMAWKKFVESLPDDRPSVAVPAPDATPASTDGEIR